MNARRQNRCRRSTPSDRSPSSSPGPECVGTLPTTAAYDIPGPALSTSGDKEPPVVTERGSRCGSPLTFGITALLPMGFHEHSGVAMTNSVC